MAEYRGAINVGTKAIWICNLMSELGFNFKESTIVYHGNRSALQVVENPIVDSKMKHVDLHVHYLRQLVQEKITSLVYFRKID